MSKKDKYDDDEYVAKLLAEDAKNSSIKYSTLGLSALLPKRSQAAHKPNTRFLSHIVREADNHNAALKKKEELEARIRLKDLQRGSRQSQADDEDKNARERKRRRPKDKRGHENEQTSRHERTTARRSRSPRRHDASDMKTDARRHRHRDEDRHPSARKHSKESRSAERPRKHEERSQRTRSEGRLPEHRDLNHTTSRPSRKRPTSTRSDSDPLEGIVGPLPPRSADKPTRICGRGTTSSSRSTIDAHFSSTYDPSQDVSLDHDPASERDDWDMALEAVRDRATWKKKQSQRLREAGWSDADIGKWARGAGGKADLESAIDGVKWSKKGEARAWDIGKPAASDAVE